MKEEADLAIVDLYNLLLDVFFLNVLCSCALAGPIRKHGSRPAYGHFNGFDGFEDFDAITTLDWIVFIKSKLRRLSNKIN